MSKYTNGVLDEPMTYGEAIVELAKVAPWPNAGMAAEAVRACQIEHDLVPPEPDVVDVAADDVHAARMAAVAAERRDLELEAAKRELEELRARVAAPQ